MTDQSEFWVGMPEFNQPSQKPYAMINIRVASEQDLQLLADALGQKLTKKTKSAWFPERKPSGVGSKRWK